MLLLGAAGAPAAFAESAGAAPSTTPVRTVRVSVDVNGVPSEYETANVSTSGDGRFTAFASFSDLVPSAPARGITQVYVRDIIAGTTVLVSSAGTSKAGDGVSNHPSISPDGRFVAFESTATNLMAGTPLDGTHRQVFVRDLHSGETRLLSRSGGTTAGSGDSTSPSISSDGTTIAFSSVATNLVSGSSPTASQIYAVENPFLGASLNTRLVSLQDSTVTPTPGPGNDISWTPDISADGTFVTFMSRSTNLTLQPSGGVSQIYIRDLRSGSTRLVSSAYTGASGANADATNPSVSADGKRIAYVSAAGNLVSSNGPPSPAEQIYVRDLSNGPSSTLISHGRSTSDVGDLASGSPSMSDSGDYLAFTSFAHGLTTASVDPHRQIYVAHVPSRFIWLASANANDDTASGSENSFIPSMSADGAHVAFTSSAPDFVATPGPAHTIQAFVRDVSLPETERIGEADRFGVSARISAETFGPGADVAYVASGLVFPDALSGSAAAGRERGPVLLTTKDTIPSVVALELARLKPKRIVVLGGANSVSQDVVDQLAGFAPTVSRIDGADRYAVSAAVSKSAFPANTPIAYVASGEVFPDALSGSAAAGRSGGPVLLVTNDRVPVAIAAELSRLNPSKIIVLGGPNTVSDDVVNSLHATRISGADRFAVSASVSSSTFSPALHTVYVASGSVFPDALSASAAAIANGSPVLLVTHDAIPEPVAAELQRLRPSRIIVLGGTTTVSDGVYEALQAFVVD